MAVFEGGVSSSGAEMSGLLFCVLRQTGLSWQLGWRSVGGDGQGEGLGGLELWGRHRLSAEHGGPPLLFSWISALH